jgi:hypothetical protein
MDNRGKNYYLVRQHESSKWFFVPWDLDLTAGICFPTERKDVMELRMYNGLFRRLMQQPEFVQAVTDRWNHLRSGLFEKDNLKSLYRQNYQRLAGNGIYDRQQRFPELRGEFESPSSEIDFLEQWLDARVDFLDGWLGNTARLVRRLQRKQNPRISVAACWSPRSVWLILNRRNFFQPKLFTAHRDVVVADGDLITGQDAVAGFVQSRVHGGFLATGANRFNLAQFIGPGQKIFATFEGFALEIGAQPVAQDRDVQTIADESQL